MLGADEEIVREDDPDPPEERLTLVGPRDAVKPGDETEVDSDTMPEKLFRLVRFIAAVPEEPEEIVRLEALILEMLKSGILTFTVTLCERIPMVAVMVTV